MDPRLQSVAHRSALVSRCPWSSNSTDAKSLFGIDFNYVPWCWKLEQDGSYTDIISKTSSRHCPAISPIEENFCFKALGGQMCLQEVNAFAQKWLAILPTELQAKVEQALERVRVAATALAHCGISSPGEGCSELDKAVAASRIITKYPEADYCRLSQHFETLDSHLRSSWTLLCMVKGFCVLLEGFATLEATSRSEDAYRQLWTSEDLDGHSRSIVQYCSEYFSVDQVKKITVNLHLESLLQIASGLASRYMTAIIETKQKVETRAADTAWAAEIIAVKWNQPIPHVSRLSSL